MAEAYVPVMKIKVGTTHMNCMTCKVSTGEHGQLPLCRSSEAGLCYGMNAGLSHIALTSTWPVASHAHVHQHTYEHTRSPQRLCEGACHLPACRCRTVQRCGDGCAVR